MSNKTERLLIIKEIITNTDISSQDQLLSILIEKYENESIQMKKQIF